ncbi:MAG: EamA family transporter [Armatimonadota bacterium]|nr:EamA family transporter [Armatimonadota bacterium]
MNNLSLALLAIVFWGAAPAFEKAALKDVSPGLGLSIRTMVIAVVILTVFFATGQHREFSHTKPSTIAILAVGAISAGVIGQWFYFAALKGGEASVIVPVVGAYPLVATILGILVFKEKITWFKATGVLMIISGVFLLKWQR